MYKQDMGFLYHIILYGILVERANIMNDKLGPYEKYKNIGWGQSTLGMLLSCQAKVCCAGWVFFHSPIRDLEMVMGC